ncbi:hypothetical protein HJG60_008134 [Phyllostomus discolor]|uniref:Uncharacterized protein n=1 Tax=Phyllostomus discolor TaxID=89673 RepID=A0A833Z1B3_9CHIR|nr:hypothetical protein HJG60_008134 [Phyllostomus discolor]
MWPLLFFPGDGALSLGLDSFPSQGPGTSGSPGRLFLNLAAGFDRGRCHVRVGTAGSLCQHSQGTLQMSREGAGPSGGSGEGQAAARALSPPGPWEEKGCNRAKWELPDQETTGFRLVPRSWRMRLG